MVNVKEGERTVIRLLQAYGAMTQEQTGHKVGKPADHLGPRFAGLERRCIIQKSRDERHNVITRKGNSGRPRNVYEIQPDRSLWLDKEPDLLTRKQVRFRDRILEEAAEVVELYEDTQDIAEAVRDLKNGD